MVTIWILYIWFMVTAGQMEPLLTRQVGHHHIALAGDPGQRIMGRP